MSEVNLIEQDMDKAVEDGYYTQDKDGGYEATDLWRKAYADAEEKAEKAIKERIKVLNKLVEEKRTFILLVYTKDCEGRDYHATEGAVNVLNEAGIPYFYTNDAVSEYDRSLYESNVNYEKVIQSSVVIFKEGEIYAGLNPDADSMKSDEDVKNWLSKYIDIE